MVILPVKKELEQQAACIRGVLGENRTFASWDVTQRPWTENFFVSCAYSRIFKQRLVHE
jgi:hypothetical protein